MPNTIMHFEIPADDVARAKAFYEKVFGWTIKAFPMPPGQEYFGVTAHKKGGPGIDGGLMKRNMPGQPLTFYVTVPSIDEMIGAVQARGAKIALPKQAIGPNMGWIAAFIDTENNLVGLHQAPPAQAAAKAAKKTAKAAKSAKKTSKPAKKAAKKKRK
jgi:uncharacterized protein